MADLYEDWILLCDEYHDAWDAQFNAFREVNNKLVKIAQGISDINPSNEELDKYEKTTEILKDVQHRMDECIKVNKLI
jgi:hypothetical protein